jgi:UDP:flavonoid glycosyltransferase YjiC (YdhE family)
MNVLFVSVGSLGDLHPLMVIAAAMRSRGHRVRLASHPQFESIVTHQEFDFESLGARKLLDDLLSVEDRVAVRLNGFPILVRGLYMPLMRTVYERLQECYREGWYIVANWPAFGARIAHERWGIPLATVVYQPSMLCSAYEKFWTPPTIVKMYRRVVDRLVLDRKVLAEIPKFCSDVGVRAPSHALYRWGFSPRKLLCLFPSWYAPPRPDHPPQIVQTGFPVWRPTQGPSLSSDLSSWLDAGDPPILFAAGSWPAAPATFFRAATDACHRLGTRSILIDSDSRNISYSPSALIRFESYVPYHRILSRCAAIVHRGGIGTVAHAMQTGVPQVISPLVHDQPDNARRCRRLHVAKVIPPSRLTGRELASTLTAMLTDSTYKESCRNIAARLQRCNGVDHTCEEIEALESDQVSSEAPR